ncbi:MAG: hypothetical protein Q6373_018510 [Candidatus Sigynarchaeota archaeon]
MLDGLTKNPRAFSKGLKVSDEEMKPRRNFYLFKVNISEMHGGGAF